MTGAIYQGPVPAVSRDSFPAEDRWTGLPESGSAGHLGWEPTPRMRNSCDPIISHQEIPTLFSLQPGNEVIDPSEGQLLTGPSVTLL